MKNAFFWVIIVIRIFAVVTLAESMINDETYRMCMAIWIWLMGDTIERSIFGRK